MPAFLAAGVPPLAGSLLMFSLRLFPAQPHTHTPDTETVDFDPEEVRPVIKSRKNSMVVF